MLEAITRQGVLYAASVRYWRGCKQLKPEDLGIDPAHVDERLIRRRVDLEVSIGDYVTSGGELPAMVMIDAIVRLLPGSLNDAGSAEQDSFSEGLLDWPHYTRPEEWQGERVPEVLLSGNHAAIAKWRRKQALARTLARRSVAARIWRRCGASPLARSGWSAASRWRRWKRKACRRTRKKPKSITRSCGRRRKRRGTRTSC